MQAIKSFLALVNQKIPVVVVPTVAEVHTIMKYSASKHNISAIVLPASRHNINTLAGISI